MLPETGAVTERRRGEFELVADLFAPLSGDDSRALSLTDDAAVLPQSAGRETVVTTDTMVAGIHFLDIETPDVVARRLLRVNLSDIASMGAKPVGYLLNLTLSEDTGDDWLDRFADGLRADQERFGVVMLGGDTTHTTGPLILSVTMLGENPAGASVRRSGARAGDLVMVSGTIGDAALGLAALTGGEGPAELVARYQLPEPRVALGQALRGLATAMADVSDGLVADLGHICAASGLAAVIDAAAVPLSAAGRARLGADAAGAAALLTGGDDYELVFTVPPDRREDALAAGEAAGVPVTGIGTVVAADDAAPRGAVAVTGPDGRRLPIEKAGYSHF